jgi:hypothetical protein
MKPLKLNDYLVIDDRNAMDHEKAILADAHEAALCMTGGMSYTPTEMALRIRRLITLAMAQQHALITLEEQHATATKRMIEAEQDKKDIQVMYREAERELMDVNGRLRAMFEKVDEVNAEYNSMQE